MKSNLNWKFYLFCKEVKAIPQGNYLSNSLEMSNFYPHYIILHKWILGSSKKSKTHEFRPQWQQIFLFCLRERPKVFGLFCFNLSFQYTYYIKPGFLCERNPNVILNIHTPPNPNQIYIRRTFLVMNWQIGHAVVE